MRQGPSGPPNPYGIAFFDNVTIIGGGNFATVVASCPGARVGDTVASSRDATVGSFVATFVVQANEVVVTLTNWNAAPLTANGNVYVEVIRRG